jgi:hypothetical protein
MKANPRSKWWLAALAGVLVGAAVFGAAPGVASAEAAACGTKDNPCPLQKWMRANMGPAAAAEDAPALAKALDKAATMSPDASWTWGKIATDGAAAAKKGDVAGAKASCKSCHDAYKDKYKNKFRDKAVN